MTYPEFVEFDLLIIGAGPSGINCAIEASKAGLKYIVIEKGALVNALFNFPTNMTFFSTSVKLEIGDIPFISHTDKPTRKEALEYYRRLFEHYNLNIAFKEEAVELSTTNNQYTLKTNRSSYRAPSIVIATGFYDKPNLMGVEGEDLPKVKHYYDEAHHYIGQNVIVVGGANSACDVALETWQKGAHVTMVVRNESLYEKVKYWILPNIENRIKEGSIKAFFNSTIESIHESEVSINTPDGKVSIPNDYVLAMTGYRPNYPLLQQFGIEFQADVYKTPVFNPDTLESNLPRVFLAGTVLGGLHTSKYFIENTRDQAQKIIQQLV